MSYYDDDVGGQSLKFEAKMGTIGGRSQIAPNRPYFLKAGVEKPNKAQGDWGQRKRKGDFFICPRSGWGGFHEKKTQKNMKQSEQCSPTAQQSHAGIRHGGRLGVIFFGKKFKGAGAAGGNAQKSLGRGQAITKFWGKIWGRLGADHKLSPIAPTSWGHNI